MAHTHCMLDNKGYRHIFLFIILIASPLQQWLCETHLIVTLYICCLFCINIMLPSMPWSSRWSHFFRPPHQNPTYISLPPHTCHILETQIIHAGSTNLQVPLYAIFLQPPVIPSQLDPNIPFSNPILGHYQPMFFV